jgi:hypothetical protein
MRPFGGWRRIRPCRLDAVWGSRYGEAGRLLNSVHLARSAARRMEQLLVGTSRDAAVYSWCRKGGRALLRHRGWIVCFVVIAALASAGVAVSKGGVTATTCGRDRCRTVTNGIAGIATLPGRVQAPRSGRFFTVSLRIETDGKPIGLEGRLRSEAPDRPRSRRARARSFMGTRWARLTRDVRRHYAKAVRGLAPKRSAPRMSR